MGGEPLPPFRGSSIAGTQWDLGLPVGEKEVGGVCCGEGSRKLVLLLSWGASIPCGVELWSPTGWSVSLWGKN